MKNFYGAIHNPNKYHDNCCDPYVADLSRHPYIKDKLRLIVCDALLAQCHGGPAYVVSHAWKASGILAGCDPVAVDRAGEKIISDRRRETDLKPLRQEKREPRYIRTAAEAGLGTDDLERIKIVTA
jgi:hypothetical protein